MGNAVTEKSLAEFTKYISDEHQAMAGTVIAANAAQAVALGEACIQISLDHQIDQLDWNQVNGKIEQMRHLKESLLTWVDQESGASSSDYEASAIDPSRLCERPFDIARLAFEAIDVLSEFRPEAYHQLSDKIDVAIQLLLGIVNGALHLLDTALMQAFPELKAMYATKRAQLQLRLRQQSFPVT